MKNLLAIAVSAAALAACATPGYDYTTRVAPDNLAVTDYRNVAVGKFRGPGGRAAKRTFEDMIASAAIDGQLWFNTGGGEITAPEGIYSGGVDVLRFDTDHYHTTSTECVEWDGPFDCEHRAEVTKACTRQSVEVAVEARLRDARDGLMVFESQHYGDASDEVCEVIAEFHEDGRGNGHNHVGDYVETGAIGAAPRALIREAARDAAADFRTEIAPYNKRVRAKIMTAALDPFAASDPRFEQAVKATKSGKQLTACSLWQSLAQTYPNAPAVTHNMGACDEASGDLERAQERYAKAKTQVGALSVVTDTDMLETLEASLVRVSATRFENELVEDLLTPVFTPGASDEVL